VFQSYNSLQSDHTQLKQTVRDQEQTLSELGEQLSASKLQLSELRARWEPAAGGWQDDDAAAACTMCQRSFTVARRKHHCRACGKIFCDDCSDKKVALPAAEKPVRVCHACYLLHTEK
jgi:hypothetical protein